MSSNKERMPGSSKTWDELQAHRSGLRNSRMRAIAEQRAAEWSEDRSVNPQAPYIIVPDFRDALISEFFPDIEERGDKDTYVYDAIKYRVGDDAGYGLRKYRNDLASRVKKSSMIIVPGTELECDSWITFSMAELRYQKNHPLYEIYPQYTVGSTVNVHWTHAEFMDLEMSRERKRVLAAQAQSKYVKADELVKGVQQLAEQLGIDVNSEKNVLTAIVEATSQVAVAH